jgi:hypothetical protein
MLFQIRASGGIAALVAEIISETLLVLDFGGLTIRLAQRQNRRESELPTDVVENADRDAGEVLQKPALAAEDAELNGKAAPVVVAAAAEHLRTIRFRQGPVAGQFLLAEILRQGHRPPGGFTRRHSGGCAPLREPFLRAKAVDRWQSYRGIRDPAVRRVPSACRDSCRDSSGRRYA